jgi:hypothetical protein
MELIKIPRIVLRHPLHYLHKNENYDILGCILLHKGYYLLDKMKFPSELKLEIPHFTRIIRKKVVDTELTHKILQLDFFPQKEAVRLTNNLLISINLQIEIID